MHIRNHGFYPQPLWLKDQLDVFIVARPQGGCRRDADGSSLSLLAPDEDTLWPMRQPADAEDSLLRALGYHEEDFISPRLPQPTHQQLQQPFQPPQVQVQVAWQQPLSPLRSAPGTFSQLCTPNRNHGPWEDLVPHFPSKPHRASPNSPAPAPFSASPASVPVLRAWEIAEQLGERDGAGEDMRALRLAVQVAREREVVASSRQAEAEQASRRAKTEVAELRAEMAGCRRREEALSAELQTERVEAAATSQRLAAEILTFREKARAQARHDELNLSASQLECRQLQFELQTAASRAQLEIAEARNGCREELQREKARTCGGLEWSGGHSVGSSASIASSSCCRYSGPAPRCIQAIRPSDPTTIVVGSAVTPHCDAATPGPARSTGRSKPIAS